MFRNVQKTLGGLNIELIQSTQNTAEHECLVPNFIAIHPIIVKINPDER